MSEDIHGLIITGNNHLDLWNAEHFHRFLCTDDEPDLVFSPVVFQHIPSMHVSHPRCSMYGLLTYIWIIYGIKVDRYSSIIEHIMGMENHAASFSNWCLGSQPLTHPLFRPSGRSLCGAPGLQMPSIQCWTSQGSCRWDSMRLGN